MKKGYRTRKKDDYLEGYMIFYPQKDKKDKNMDLHTIKRFRERYNFDAEHSDIKKICKAIQNRTDKGDCTAHFLARLSKNKTLFRVKYKNMKFVVVYHKEKKKLCTILKPEMVEEYTKKPKKEYIDNSTEESPLLL